MIIQEDTIREFLRTNREHLHHREGQELEFKEQFNLAGLAEYFRDFAAFANNRGGHILFGVTDRPRKPIGLNASAIEQFEKIDPEKISGFILEIFSSDIRWHQQLITVGDKSFGVFRIEEAVTKPVIAKKDEGKDQTIKNGEIYYRYGGRTQKIQYLTKEYPYSAAELADAVKKQVPEAHLNRIWETIKENDLKNNRAYSAYNFRNKMHEDGFLATGKLPSVTPTIYNDAAVEFIVKVIRNTLTDEYQALKT